MKKRILHAAFASDGVDGFIEITHFAGPAIIEQGDEVAWNTK